jgi:hypothetical protein
MVRVPYFSCALVLAVAACGGSDPVDDKTRGTGSLPAVTATGPTAIGEPHGKTQPAKPLPPAESQVPASLRGRWGLTPVDCMPGRSDAKGLLVVTSDRLRFYESQAVPTTDVEADANSISGNFAFTGEGQSWTKYEALNLDKHGLTRTETEPTASFRYAKCS